LLPADPATIAAHSWSWPSDCMPEVRKSLCSQNGSNANRFGRHAFCRCWRCSSMRPNAAVRPEYVDAFQQIAGRIAAALHDVPAADLPIKVYVAGGAAPHLYG
jgi:hypothetical protein